MRFSILVVSLLPVAALANFDPTSFTRQTASCGALNRDTGEIVEIELSYVEINPTAPITLLFAHGWPGLWSTWARQIEEFKEDYHLILPDLRGFGRSTHPGDVKGSGTLFDMVGDLVCVLENANVAEAICVGHDWGSGVCYEAGRSRPDVFTGVVGGVVPYIPLAGDFLPIRNLVPFFPKLTYQLFFDGQTAEAVRELDMDIRRSLRSTMRAKLSPPPTAFLTSSETFLGAWEEYDEIPSIPYFSPEEEDYMVKEFAVQGYQYSLQFYTNENRHASWKHAHDQGNHTLYQPVLAIYPTHDPVADWIKAAEVLKSNSFLTSLTTAMVEGSHWIHLENPDAFNAAMKSWLTENFRANAGRVGDEL